VTSTPSGARPTIALVHSPLTGPAAWGRLPDVLRGRGHDVAVVDVQDDDTPPYATRFVARAALQVRDAVADGRVVLVGHSGAGYLLPLLGAARRAARSPVRGYLFVDAGLPPSRPASRSDQLRTEDPGFADELDGLLAAGGRFPQWTDDDLRELVPDHGLRAALVASLRPRGADFFDEPLPIAPDWPDAPCGYLHLTVSYDGAARVAGMRGWPVLGRADDRPGGHFAALVDPDALADDLEALLARL
jgi:pimeloyl-ACP methyl ester carboxylesterase